MESGSSDFSHDDGGGDAYDGGGGDVVFRNSSFSVGLIITHWTCLKTEILQARLLETFSIFAIGTSGYLKREELASLANQMAA